MVKCEVCNREFSRINSFHLKTHGILNETEYLQKYPKATIMSNECKNKISATTKIGMAEMTIEEKENTKYFRTDAYKENRKKITLRMHSDGLFKNAYTSERNKIISDKKKLWWATIGHEVMKDKLFFGYIGSEKHINMCKANQHKATKAALGKTKSKPEADFENKLIENNIKYETQYYVGGYPFDFYLPDENLLVEIDGVFYHPISEEDCIYPIQKHNYNRDIKKSKAAIDAGYNLERIRV